MASTLADTTSQIEELEQKIAKLREAAKVQLEQERNRVLEETRKIVGKFQFTAAELRLSARGAKKSSSGAGTKAPPAPPKYRGPQGQVWAGGRGRQPAWVKEAKERGESLDDYLIK